MGGTQSARSFTETESRLVSRGWKEGARGTSDEWGQFQFGTMREALEVMVAVAAQRCECT